MHTAARYVLLVVAIIIGLHFILSITHEPYGRVTSFSNIASKFSPPPSSSSPSWSSSSQVEDISEWIKDTPYNITNTDGKANATFVILARNSDLDGVVTSIREVEDKFNRQHNYPYVFLNEKPFDEDFKKRVSVLTGSKTIEFGLISPEHWYQPDSIDETKAEAERKKLVDDKVIYGGSVPYRNMCRFNSGFFFKHPLLQKYRWYWRIEPNVHFHCNILHDPFVFMEKNDKAYAFTITLYEYRKTIPTLWGHVKDFMALHPEYIAKDNALDYMSDDRGASYNLCHFWSNFEIADMDFWRSEAYQKFFEYLDDKGGFYYERWGDAPVHSIAAALFLPKTKIHFFDEIGYEHAPYTHCPRDDATWRKGRCSCSPQKSFDYDGYSCMKQWERIW